MMQSPHVEATEVAAVIAQLLQLGFFSGSSRAEQLREVHELACSATKLRLPEFTVSSLSLDTWPHLEGFKAAEVKVLLLWLESLLQGFFLHTADEVVQLMTEATEGLCDFVRSQDLGGNVLSAGEVETASAGLIAFQQSYLKLANYPGLVGFKLRPKFHSLSHLLILIQQTHWNSKGWACWMDEDFMARLRTLVQCVKAKGVPTARHVLKRYAFGRCELARHCR